VATFWEPLGYIASCCGYHAEDMVDFQ